MTIDLTQEQIQLILKGTHIPPQPQIMVDLQIEQMMPDPSLSHIGELISQDVGLSGKILKTVNSASFGLANNITSIKQAVCILGATSVINLVNALSIRGELSNDQIITLGSFWDNAMEIAEACAAIAKQIGYSSPEEAYSLGLFHNCGVPLLMMRFDNYPDVILEAYARSDQSITDTENGILQTNHAVVGYYVAKSWNLPDHISQAIHEHHNVEYILQDDAQNPQKITLLAILKMAENICGNYKNLGQQSEDHEWQRISDQVLVYVGLTAYEYENLCLQLIDMGIGASNSVSF